MGMRRELRQTRRGLTIYEVFLALTLLLGALAVLAQHIAVGTRAGARGRLQTQAAMFAETKLAEILGGVEPMSPASGAAITGAPAGWTWSLEVAAGPQEDLLDLAVTATHTDLRGSTDASFTLRRLVRDPQVFLDAAVAASSEDSSNSSSPSGSSSSSSTGPSSSGSSTSSRSGGSSTSRTGGTAR